MLLSGLAVFQAKAQILLTVDDSNPSAVTFTATGNDPEASDASHLYSQGITLAGFNAVGGLAGLIPTAPVVSAGLVTGVDGTPAYNGAQSGSITGTFLDLELYSGSGATENFATGTAAFSGVSTFNFSGFSADLPTVGTTGLIYAGSGAIFSASPVVIGSYIVTTAPTPEPSTYAMLLGGLAILGFCLRGRTALRS